MNLQNYKYANVMTLISLMPQKTPNPVHQKNHGKRFSGLLAGTIAAMTLTSAVLADSVTPVDTKLRSTIETVVAEMLRTRPELIQQALDEQSRRLEAEKAEQQQRLVAVHLEAVMSTNGAGVLGNPHGDVTLVEFLDYRCGYCKRASNDIDTLISQDPNLRVLIKQLPILGPESVLGARLALTAAKSDRFAEAHRQMLTAESLDASSLKTIAASIQLPGDTYSDTALDGQIEATVKLARELQIQGTPGFVVGGRVYSGAIPLEVMRALVQATRLAQRKSQKAG